ncbi:PIG-L family deacetylase [Actinosynnema sp. NPDC023587]|uniref:PIG-L deacetylase family protein n=1 Tax=Actinosynnema sp. NPDC023587 TaxID=3154695 RepID=UPI003407C303
MTPPGERTALVVVAHPDDAEIAMGMKIRWYADHGVDVHVHCLSQGFRNGDRRTALLRVEEARAAGEVLGVREYTFSDVPDNGFVDHRRAVNAELFRLMEAVRPDVVYTHYPQDQHLDHRITAEEVLVAALREAADIRLFRSPYSVDFTPTAFFLGDAELMAAKMAALRCFTSQPQWDLAVFEQLAAVAHRQHVHHRVLERAEAAGGPSPAYAEMFVIRRLIEIDRVRGGVQAR